MHAAVQSQAPPESIAAYIEDMVGELASLAESIGERHLAASLRLLAIEAAWTAPMSKD